MALTRSRPLPVTAEVKKMGRTLLRGEKRVLVPARVWKSVETSGAPANNAQSHLSPSPSLLIDLLAHDILRDGNILYSCHPVPWSG